MLDSVLAARTLECQRGVQQAGGARARLAGSVLFVGGGLQGTGLRIWAVAPSVTTAGGQHVMRTCGRDA